MSINWIKEQNGENDVYNLSLPYDNLSINIVVFKLTTTDHWHYRISLSNELASICRLCDGNAKDEAECKKAALLRCLALMYRLNDAGQKIIGQISQHDFSSDITNIVNDINRSAGGVAL